jgi:hypothetical protein
MGARAGRVSLDADSEPLDGRVKPHRSIFGLKHGYFENSDHYHKVGPRLRAELPRRVCVRPEMRVCVRNCLAATARGSLRRAWPGFHRQIRRRAVSVRTAWFCSHAVFAVVTVRRPRADIRAGICTGAAAVVRHRC